MRAGLIPALRNGVLPGSDEWSVILDTPGRTPRRTLHEALVGDSSTPADTGSAWRALRNEVGGDTRVIVVDQFEEVFSACSDEFERTAFVDTLVDAATDPDARVSVVITIRADSTVAARSIPPSRNCSLRTTRLSA